MSGASSPLKVGVIGCGLIGARRAASLGFDVLVGTFDVVDTAARDVAAQHGAVSFSSLEELLACDLDVVVVATRHSDLAPLSIAALESGAHVLVEKPAGMGTAEVARIAEVARRSERLVKVGFNHRFHPGIARAVSAARSGKYGEVISLRARYGHGGRLGYEKEWRADPALSGGGEIVDQGMHLLDISYWLLGALPLRGSLVRTMFWDARVDDNAVLLLGGSGRREPFSELSVSWTEWKNLFSLEITCRTAKFCVDGLTRSYGAQQLRIYTMRPEFGPPDLETAMFSERDVSWELEWQHFAAAIRSGSVDVGLLGDLASAEYAWGVVEQAQQA